MNSQFMLQVFFVLSILCFLIALIIIVPTLLNEGKQKILAQSEKKNKKSIHVRIK
jgi:hypothetical protein